MSAERPVFVAHTLCPPHLRKQVEDVAESFNPDWLLPPKEGEMYNSFQECFARLQGYAFSKGFAVVTLSSNRKKARAQFGYIHHAEETKNWRKLEKRVEKDPVTKEVVSNRKRGNHTANAKGCPWAAYWSVRSVGKRGSGVVAGQLGITMDTHNHILAPNPFIYKVHKKATSQHQQAVGLALGHRLAHQPYSSMRMVLNSSGLRLDRTTYYNLIRGAPLRQSWDSFEGLVLALEEAGFRFACRMTDELADDGSVIGQVLEQVFFAIDTQLAWAKRFIAHHVLLIDETFETNKVGLILLVVVGVTSTGKNFPAAYSFAKSEARVVFDFIFDSLKHWVFGNEVAEARVILGDQAPGLIASTPESMPNCKLQHCNWHVAQNLKKRLAEKRYTKDERKAIMDKCWFYIQSKTEADLTENRKILMDAMNIGEQDFMRKHWLPKEDTFVALYTSKDPNLGCNSNQRAESTHPVTTTLLNHQLSLAEATRRLAKGIKLLLEDLAELESESYGSSLAILDLRPFSSVIGQVTKYALQKIAGDWEICKQAVSTGTANLVALEECQCELLLRYSLPCKHHLLHACEAGLPIPRSLFHPRWWLDGPPISKTFLPWKPYYSTARESHALQQPNDISSLGQQIMEVREGFTGLAKARFEEQLVKTNRALLGFAEQIRDEDLLPTRLPDKIKKPKWVKPIKSHGKASARSLTGPEAAEKEADKAERDARKQMQEDAIEVIPNSPGCPSTPPSRKRTRTLVERTPGKPPTPGRAAPALPQPPEAPPSPPLPPSTAPARLYIGKGGRERKRTSKGAMAKAEGWLSESQPRE